MLTLWAWEIGSSTDGDFSLEYHAHIFVGIISFNFALNWVILPFTAEGDFGRSGIPYFSSEGGPWGEDQGIIVVTGKTEVEREEGCGRDSSFGVLTLALAWENVGLRPLPLSLPPLSYFCFPPSYSLQI